MEDMNLKKEAIWMLVMGFGLAFYHVYVEQPYLEGVKASGGVPGVFEIGLGIVGAIFVIRLVAWFLTRKVDQGGYS